MQRRFYIGLIGTLFTSGLFAQGDYIQLPLDSKVSVMRIGTTPHPVTTTGKTVATLVWEAVDKNNLESAQKAIQSYQDLLKTENETGDYSALLWLCESMVLPESEREVRLTDPLTHDFYHFFADSNYAKLKEYLLREYALNNFIPKDMEKHEARKAFLVDFMMFNNPKRNDWEKSNDLLEKFELKKGDAIIDIGCGFGYYSYRFSQKVGPSGKVYAVDTSEPYIRYLEKFIEKYRIGNIEPVVSTQANLMVNEPIDVAFMCSVYHIIYGWQKEGERAAFISSLKHILKKNGLLVIADNSFCNGDELNNCYLNKELVIAQLYFYGFQFVEYAQITPQRYVLIFRHTPAEPGQFPAPLYPKGERNDVPYALSIESGNSVIHIGSLDSYDITEQGIEAAKLVYEALKHKNLDAAKEAVAYYDNLIPKENFGGEYSCLQWFCEYLTASPERQTEMLDDPLVRATFDYLAKDDFAILKKFVDYKYRLALEEKNEQIDKIVVEEDPAVGRTKRAFVEDFILFNNPRRTSWEESSKIMERLPLSEGQIIADIGCGPGYFSYKFSKRVGDQGKVFAIDVKQEHLDFLNDFIDKQNIKNIQTIQGNSEDIRVSEPVDYAFMCSLYHIIYGVYPESDRHNFLTSIKKALKKTGRFIVIDNGPVEGESLPYHGPYICKELIISQLAYYGFVLETYEQIIPQRYMLTFRIE